MYATLLIGEDSQACDTIRTAIEQHFAEMVFQGMAPAHPGADPGHRAPDLIIWDAQGQATQQLMATDTFPRQSVNVLLLDHPIYNELRKTKTELSSLQACLHKPLYEEELLITLLNGRHLIELRRTLEDQARMLAQVLTHQGNPGMVGIPTEAGMEFLMAEEIIRCEGLNKYTMILTTSGTKLVSSYNIGEFAKILLCHGFYSPHKSHLVNLRCIRRLTDENQIILRDGSQVPLSRRRRLDFLQRFRGKA